LAGLVLVLGGVPVLRAATPRDELLRFVPENTAFCLVFQDLRTRWADLRNSPFAEQFRQSGLPGVPLSEEDRLKLDRFEKHLEKVGLDWARLRDDILGDALVLAFRPGPPGQPQQDKGLFLLRAQNAQALTDLITRFNDSQKKADVLKDLQELEYNGVKYVRRVSNRDTTYYLQRGPILLLTSQEEMIKQALDQDRALAQDAEPPLTRHLKQLSADRALLALWVNPRAFDAAVKGRVTQVPPSEVPAATTVATCWKSVEGIVLSLHLDRDVELVLGLRARTGQLPTPTRHFLAQASQPCELWRLFHDDSLLALNGRLDFPALLDTIGELLSPKTRQTLHGDLNNTLGATLGRNFVKDVLPYLGPDLGLCVTAPAKQAKGWVPHLLLALRVAKGDPVAPADQAALSVVQLLAQVAIFAHNSQRPSQLLELKKRTVDKGEIRFVSGDGVFPPGVQPAFALHGGYLVLASSPDIIERFAQPQPGNAAAPEKGIPLLRISFQAWRTYLKERRAELIEVMTANKELTPEEAGKRLDGLVESLRLLDRLELRQRTSKDQVVFTLSLQPSLPLKK
jgi:hypothetical protein